MKPIKIFINPGHAPNGIPDPGAVNKEYGVTEAEAVRFIGDNVAVYLRAAGLDVILCQDDNLNVGDDSVVAQANKSGADLVLSIHANSYVNPIASGTETYCFARGSEAERLAQAVQWQLVHTINTVDRGVKTASYAILRETIQPAILCEVCFVSNPDDVKLLKDVNAMIQMARAISRGVTDYLTFC